MGCLTNIVALKATAGGLALGLVLGGALAAAAHQRMQQQES